VNGPYLVTRWRSGHSLDLTTNPHYYGAAQTLVPRVQVRFHPPGAQPYVDDEVDWCRVDDAPELAERYSESTLTVQYLATYFLGFNCARAPFDRPEVRRALAYCVDQVELVAASWGGVQQPATGGVVPPGIPGHSPAIGLPYDPEAGRALLAAAGVEGLRIRLAATADFGQTPAFLQRCWQEQLGIQVELVTDIDVDTVFNDFAVGAFDALLIGWDMESPDPLTILGDVFHSASELNLFGWRNTAFDALIDTARAAGDSQETYVACHEADRILMHDAAIIPLYYPRSVALLRPTFHLRSDTTVLRGDRLRLKQLIPAAGGRRSS
jgi:ABC-type oligopeptide transport system substrate-binding subunit